MLAKILLTEPIFCFLFSIPVFTKVNSHFHRLFLYTYLYKDVEKKARTRLTRCYYENSTLRYKLKLQTKEPRWKT